MADADPELLTELTRRGITEAKARELLAKLKPGQEVIDQLEYVDALVANDKRGKLENPPGLYVMYIRDNTTTPADFCSSRKARLHREANQVKNAELARKARQDIDYAGYREAEILRFAESLNSEEYETLFAAKRVTLRPLFRSITSQQLDDMTHRALRSELETSGRVPLISLQDFCESSMVPD